MHTIFSFLSSSAVLMSERYIIVSLYTRVDLCEIVSNDVFTIKLQHLSSLFWKGNCVSQNETGLCVLPHSAQFWWFKIALNLLLFRNSLCEGMCEFGSRIWRSYSLFEKATCIQCSTLSSHPPTLCVSAWFEAHHLSVNWSICTDRNLDFSLLATNLGWKTII